ncbi:FadR/GntR family transcriptional regulator [Micrococcus sp.]|uniref:FadR/GntR family transcriptional regulator n=1 Tax=Micrococcus sp. TaxID=1271 RepID=UPI002A91894B|nr:FCD domain-containing protein [Micrococcus sp.]MDY6054747.1 FCD domain-containing protein [Micrococcus sp.]
MAPTPRTYSVVTDWLEGELRAGRIRVGDKLPGERALAEHFQISRASVREATRILDAMGLVRSSTGSGPQAGAVVVSEPSAALGWALRLHIATRALPVADLVDMRVLLETQGAREAAARPDHPERAAVLAEAQELFEQMDVPGLPSDSFHPLDTRFHEVLASLADNLVLDTMLASLRQAVLGYVRETVSTLPDWESVRVNLQQEHREILEAVTARDTDRAVAALTRHIEGFSALALRIDVRD